MVGQYIHHSWQMKEQLLGISISFYLEKIDKLFMLQHNIFVELSNIPYIYYCWMGTIYVRQWLFYEFISVGIPSKE